MRRFRTSQRWGRAILFAPEEPTLLATLGHASLLQQAVMIEQLQLSLLALLPARLSQSDEQHYHFHFDPVKKILPRYTHKMTFHRIILKTATEQGIALDEKWVRNMQGFLIFSPI